MRSILRSLTFGLAATLASASMAQYLNYWSISGTIGQCYAGQTVDLTITDGTNVVLTGTLPVDPGTCTFGGVFGISTPYADVAITTMCSGMVLTVSDSAVFNFLQDTVSSNVWLDCGNSGLTDCNGVMNGPDMPGTSCDDGNPMTFGDVWTPACACVGVDTSYTDCAGITNGPNLPGAPCTDFFGNAGIYGPDCNCQTNSQTDCLGNPGGGALPGTPCTYTPDSGNTWITGIWSPDCVCGPDSSSSNVDCLGVEGGSALPGTPCAAFGMVGTWNSACECVPNPDCNADFWVIQAMGSDSLPVPYELWVWNLSSGGSGNFAFTWDFGDGTTSSEAFPTHTYAGNGPYNLCLSIADNNGCSDMYCDSISINGDGIYEGMVVHAEDRQDGFTINVQDPQANAVKEIATSGSISTWPNPAVDELNVAVVSDMIGMVTLTITDLDGRTVKSERVNLAGNRSQLRIATGALNAGMYMLRITDGATNLTQRFVKTN